MEIKHIARIYTDFPEKFGIPRQSGLVPSLMGRIVFEEPYRNPDMLRGLDGFDRIWLIWHFSESPEGKWSPTVRPPRLGGEIRKGVFATRSPFRPNPIGLSCVKIEEIRLQGPDGPTILVSGIDLMSGTPILDIKPYLPYADSHPDARAGFTTEYKDYRLEVHFPEELLGRVPEDKRQSLFEVLAEDPRPGYQHSAERVYGIIFADQNIRFQVDGRILQVLAVDPVID